MSQPGPGLPPVSDEDARTIWREDLTAVLLSILILTGLLLDGWSHLNQRGGRLGTFFTPWHGLLYAGFTANAAWVITRNRHLWRHTQPPDAFHRLGPFRLRYPFGMAGIALAGVGMIGDLFWHTAISEETDVARVIAPFHVVLFLGAGLLIAAPLRSAWHAPTVYPRDASLPRLAPPMLSLAFLTVLGCFMFQWLSPFMEWRFSRASSLNLIVPTGGAGVQTTMAARIVVTNMVFVAPLLLAMRRWALPVGAAIVSVGLAAFATSALTSFSLVGECVAVTGGVVLVETIRVAGAAAGAQTKMYVLAVALPLACWPLYFLVLRWEYGANWPADFALGVSCLAALLGLGLAFLSGLPPALQARR